MVERKSLKGNVKTGYIDGVFYAEPVFLEDGREDVCVQRRSGAAKDRLLVLWRKDDEHGTIGVQEVVEGGCDEKGRGDYLKIEDFWDCSNHPAHSFREGEEVYGVAYTSSTGDNNVFREYARFRR